MYHFSANIQNQYNEILITYGYANSISLVTVLKYFKFSCARFEKVTRMSVNKKHYNAIFSIKALGYLFKTNTQRMAGYVFFKEYVRHEVCV
jgi:hypothetical protein